MVYKSKKDNSVNRRESHNQTSCRPTLSSSTSLSGGNQVDGLPPARHTEAIGGAPWGFGLSTYRCT